MKMFCKLCVVVVLIYSIIVADIHAQNSFISKSINLTTLIGETVELNCSEYNMESQNSNTQLFWFKNEESISNILKNSSTMSLDGDTLTITNVTYEDTGIYKCVTFNQSRYDSYIYTLIVKDAQNSFISKSINLTTLIGESVELNCSEYIMESRNSTTQLSWFKNEESISNILKNSSTMSLDGLNDTLRITNVTHEDTGTYKCVTFNQSHYDFSIYTLIVKDLPELKPNYVYTSNITASKDLSVLIRCMRYMDHDTKNYNNQNHLYFKDERLLILKKSNKRTWVEENFDFKIDKIIEGDNGAYKCVSSNKFRIDYAVTYLNVVGNYYDKRHPYFYDEIVNQTKHLNEIFFLPYYEKSWFKNDKTFNSSEENTCIENDHDTKKLIIQNLTFEDAGDYTCNLSNRYHNTNLHYSLNVIDRPEKLYFRLFDSNISLIIGKTYQLKCHLFKSTENYTTWYSWKKNGEKLVLNNNTENMNFKKNQSILIISNLTSNESGIYECEAESYYHIVYSAYTLTIPGNTTKSIVQVNSTFDYLVYLTCILFFTLIISVTICCICWLRRKKTSLTESDANKLQSMYEHREKWKSELDIEVHIYESPYDIINKAKMK